MNDSDKREWQKNIPEFIKKFIHEEELNELDILIDRFKDGVNRCDISAIATNSRNISSRLKILSINSITMTKKQMDDLTILQKESSIQFDRLSKGRCACSMVKNI